MSYRKYGNQRHNGKASKHEADVGQNLAILEQAGKIQNLRAQVPVVLIPPFELNGKKYRGITWIADYVWEEDGKTIYADCKGCETAVYKLKRTLAAAMKQIEIFEIRR